MLPRMSGLLTVYILAFVFSSVDSFAVSPSATTNRYARGRALNLSEDLPLLGEECIALSSGDDSSSTCTFMASLNQRKKELEMGIGKRYVCRTQKGFLNVHMEPGEPFNPYNIVNQLHEGDIVTSVGPPRGAWIKHDSGGWSIAVYNGFTWLEELKE